MSVDFPEPLAPRMPKISLRPTVKETSSTARTSLVCPRRNSGRWMKTLETWSTTAAGSMTRLMAIPWFGLRYLLMAASSVETMIPAPSRCSLLLVTCSSRTASRRNAGKKEPRARGLSSARGGKCCVMLFDHVSPPTGRLRPLAPGAMSHTRGHTTGRPLLRPENPVLVKIRSIACLPNRDTSPSRGQGARVGVACPDVNDVFSFGTSATAAGCRAQRGARRGYGSPGLGGAGRDGTCSSQARSAAWSGGSSRSPS